MHAARPGNARHITLRVQADVLRTFGPLLIPLSLILVGWGAFELDRAITHPLETDAATILFSSVILACGLLLAVFLVRSVHLSVATVRQTNESAKVAEKQNSRPRPPIQTKAAPVPRPFHRFYVDDVRISR